MKFRDVPFGSCFKIGRSRAIHKKNGESTYIDDLVGEEITVSPTKNVRVMSSCPTAKTLLELGNARKKNP